MNCKECKSPCVGEYRQNLNAGRSAWCIEYLKESRMGLEYSNSSVNKRFDSRREVAAKYRREAEQSALSRDLEQSEDEQEAEDMLEAMNEDLEAAIERD